MATTFDAKSTASTIANNALGTTGVTHALLTIGASATAATFEIQFSAAVSSVVVTWDNGGTNQNVPLIVKHANSNSLAEAHIYGLTNPTTGNKTLKVTWNAVTVDCIVSGQSWTGSDTTGGATTFNNTATNDDVAGSTALSTVTVTTTTSDAVVASHNCAQTITAINNTAGYGSTGISSAALEHGAANYEVGGATATLTATTTADDWTAVGTNIKGAAGGDTLQGSQSMRIM
jgi:hypothetical protein